MVRCVRVLLLTVRALPCVAAMCVRRAAEWFTVDYKLFKSREPLPPNTLYVSEQIPGYHAEGDQTVALQRGHWPSYNVAFYPEIYERSGYPAVVKQFGPSVSYQLAPRAPIFRAYADGTVTDLPSMRTFMRLNKYNKSDPLGLFPTPTSAIAARGDLVPPPGHKRLAGAYDAKITSKALIDAGLGATAIAGPTSVDQPVFRWSDWPGQPHYGHPPEFDFDWQVFKGM